jgi:hypothetical protein
MMAIFIESARNKIRWVRNLHISQINILQKDLERYSWRKECHYLQWWQIKPVDYFLKN